MAFDECTPGDADYNYAKKSLELTQRWLNRCFDQFEKTEPKYGYPQSLFPIVQGNTFPELRKQAATYVKTFDADGYAIGGLSVGEPEEVMYEMTEVVNAELPENKPRYLMGVGTPLNILESIDRGVDMFDCVMPTRNGRNGMLFTSEGNINIRNKKWENDHSPIDPKGTSFVDQYSKAYLRHLIISNEMLGAQIASQHNLAFYLWLVKTARQKITEGAFKGWKNKMVKRLKNRL
jgi:queuine tRNA-ribosyltransferase